MKCIVGDCNHQILKYNCSYSKLNTTEIHSYVKLIITCNYNGRHNYL